MGIGDFSSVLTNGTVNGTGTNTSSAIDTRQTRFLSVHIQATSSSGTPNLRVQWQASDTSLSGYVVPDDVSDLYGTLNDENVHIKQIFAPPASFGNIKLTGNSGNPADTIVNIKVFNQT